jgi:hypothetical protein
VVDNWAAKGAQVGSFSGLVGGATLLGFNPIYGAVLAAASLATSAYVAYLYSPVGRIRAISKAAQTAVPLLGTQTAETVPLAAEFFQAVKAAASDSKTNPVTGGDVAAA